MRGRGLFLAFDLPDRDNARRILERAFRSRPAGAALGRERSIRFRPAAGYYHGSRGRGDRSDADSAANAEATFELID